MVKITHGSIFDKKCDLLIIPCNSNGGVTHWVFSGLKQNGINVPDKYIPLGKVLFVDTKLDTENAEIVGFAASVDDEAGDTPTSAITSIGSQIFDYCKSNGLRQVNIPLLGSGAGGLSEFASFEALKPALQKKGATEICFEVFVPSLETYKSFKTSYPALFEKPSATAVRNPRVFISYAADDKDNARWVKDLAIKLRQNGVDARLDRFHLKAGTDLPQWMTNEVIMADKVLLVCDYSYMIKADVHRGGVGWETMIVQGDMLTQGETKGKYIAIVRETEINKGLPIYMKSKLALHWKKEATIEEEDFKELLFTIFDCDTAPDLGDIPDFIADRLANPGSV